MKIIMPSIEVKEPTITIGGTTSRPFIKLDMVIELYQKGVCPQTVTLGSGPPFGNAPFLGVLSYTNTGREGSYASSLRVRSIILCL
jgi:hypothetical protein